MGFCWFESQFSKNVSISYQTWHSLTSWSSKPEPDESVPRSQVGLYSERLNTLLSIRSQNLYSLGKQSDSIIMNIVLALLVFQSAFLQAKICQIKQKVSKPVRQSYLENVRKTVSYPCCTNIACDPPVCKKVCAINVKCIFDCLNDEHSFSLICPDIICDILISSSFPLSLSAHFWRAFTIYVDNKAKVIVRT